MLGNFDLQGITFKSYLTDGEYFQQLSPDFLDELYAVGTTAFQAELGQHQRTAENVDYVMGGREDFPTRLTSPEMDVTNGRLLPDQSFSNPSITVAFANNSKSLMRIVAFGYGVSNTSGSDERIRRVKQLSHIYNHRLLKTVATLPDYQGRGIATVISAANFAKARSLEPGAAYTWPSEGGAGTGLVESLGMRMTENGSRNRDLYGTGESIEQRRYEVSRASRVVEGVIKRGGSEVEKIIRRESLRQVRRSEQAMLSYWVDRKNSSEI